MMETQIVWRLPLSSNELNGHKLHIGSLGYLLVVAIENLISLRNIMQRVISPLLLGGL